MMAPNIAPFQTLVKDRCGLDLCGDNAPRLAHAVQARMAALHLKAAPYLDRLRADLDEFQALVNALTINETYFMRERVQLDWLVQALVPRLREARGPDAKLRILSAGCSSGEEPYSIAMALLDAHGERASQQCAVMGVDIDTRVLEKAREGRYGAFSFRAMPQDVLARYFDQDGATWVVRDAVRAMVCFQAFNLLSQNASQDLRDFDVILFRNVSIYFDPPTRQIILENLRTLLRADGVLITGVSETLANDVGVLHLREESGFFYFSPMDPGVEKAVHARTPLISAAASASTHASVTRPPVQTAPIVVTPVKQRSRAAEPFAPNLESARELVQSKAFEPAHHALAVLLQAQPDQIEVQLLMAYVLLNRKDYGQAMALVQRILAVHEWSVDALYLLGHIHRWQQQSDGAIDGFKRAVYACPTCWPAHYYLGALYRESGASALARRSLRAVQQLLADGAPSGLQYVPVELPCKEMHQLCERQLANLAPRSV